VILTSKIISFKVNLSNSIIKGKKLSEDDLLLQMSDKSFIKKRFKNFKPKYSFYKVRFMNFKKKIQKNMKRFNICNKFCNKKERFTEIIDPK
jgi:hypothetical protein